MNEKKRNLKIWMNVNFYVGLAAVTMGLWLLHPGFAFVASGLLCLAMAHLCFQELKEL